MIRPTFSELFIDITLKIARRSSCVKAQQAALLVKDNRIISFGYNGPPAGTINCIEEGIQTEGCAIYCTQSPCISCAKLVVASGINIFFYLEDYRLRDGLDFLKSSNIKTLRIKKWQIATKS